MSYQVLARKWRPQVFEDVVGQGHITRTLQNAIVSGRLAHAFLFSGPRGVGKTTTARILAKALNCAQGPTPVPCGKCDSCLETTAGTSVDVIEIDGASNRGIEHIRELREAVRYAPTVGKHKVYVIDEVHMLTNEAFNALLKTLEEPPPHVMFIFATTEPQKIPATIHSRCQRYGFKRIPLQEITGRLRMIADTEGIKITDQGLSLIARAAEGSMRDSQSLLDQAVSYSGMEISDTDLQATLGSVAQLTLLQFTHRLLTRDASGLLKQLEELLEQGQDLRQFLSGVVEHLRNLLVVKTAREPGQLVELPAADIEAIRQQASEAEPERLILFFDSLSKTLDDMRWSPHQRFTLEIGLLKACSLTPLKPLAEMLSHVKELEARISSGRRQTVETPAHGVCERPASYTSKAPASSPAHTPPHETGDAWGRIMAALKSTKPSLAAFLEHAKFMELSDTAMTIGVYGDFQRGQVEKRENRDYIEKTAEKVLGKKIPVVIQPLTETSKPGIKNKVQKKTKDQEHDPLVQDVLKVFNGEHIETDTTEN